MQAAVQTVKWGTMTVKSFAARFNLSKNRGRYYFLLGGVSKTCGRAPFVTASEGALLARFINTNATIGRGLSQDAVCLA